MPATRTGETDEYLSKLRPRSRSNTFPTDKVTKVYKRSTRRDTRFERWVLTPVPEDVVSPNTYNSVNSLESLEWDNSEQSLSFAKRFEDTAGSSVFDANKSWNSTSSKADPRRDSVDTRFNISAVLNKSLNKDWSVSRISSTSETDDLEDFRDALGSPPLSTSSTEEAGVIHTETAVTGGIVGEFEVSVNTRKSEYEINKNKNNASKTNNPPTLHTQTPVNTDLNMEVKPYRINIRIAAGFFEDVVTSIDLKNARTSRIADAVKVAESHVAKLIEAQAFLEECESDEFAQLVSQCRDTKKSLLKFVNSADVTLRQREERERAPSPSKIEARASRELQKESVSANFQKYIDLLDESRKELEHFSSSAPNSDGQFRVLEDRFRELSSKVNPIIAAAKDLIKSAMDCGMKDEYRSMRKALESLEEIIHETKTDMCDKKAEFGITSFGGGFPGNKLPDIKPPHFSGNHSDKIDFYTFKHEFFECLELRNFSASEQVRFLLRTCLHGDAQSSCEGMKSLDEIFSHLQGLYGNVQLLFSTKLAEIRGLGTCQGSNEKRRQWAINVRSKLKYLLNLCKTHNKESDLFHSSLPNEIHNALPRDHGRQLSKLLRKNSDLGREEKFNVILTFLDEVVDDLTFDLNKEVEDVGFGLNTVALNSKNSKSGNPAAQPKPFAKKSHHVLSQECSGPAKSKMKKSAQGKAKSPQVVLSAQSDDSVIYSPPPPRKNKNAKSTSVLASFVPPMEADCPLCNRKHTHVYYCPEFQSLGPKDRYNSLDRSGICFRCLRLDAKIDFKDRERWFLEHESSCQSQFVCAVSGCRKKPKFRQLHIVICGWHSDGNKSQEDDFLKSLDQSKIKPGLKFFFNSHLAAFQASYEPNEALVTRKSSDGFEILPDVHEPAIYFLHKIPDDNGNPLLVFYDSGCSSSAISSRAYNNLTTETVRPGPTILSVAGNQQIMVEHGDERFFLELYGMKKKATMTGLRMDSITSQFPLLHLQEAWNEVAEAYKKGIPNGPPLPKVHDSVGGTEVDIMIGIRYLKFFPKEVFTLPCGLGLYRAQIRAFGDCQGILGGPHRAWRHAEESSNFMSPRCFFTSEMRAFVSQDIALHSLIGPVALPEEKPCLDPAFKVVNCDRPVEEKVCSFVHCPEHEGDLQNQIPVYWNVLDTMYSVKRDLKDFMDAENLGTDVSYRCVKCRNCANCRKGELLEKASLVEEQEQALIEDCLRLDVDQKRLYSKLPFIQDPLLALKPNLHIAESVLRAQISAAQKCEVTREEIIKSHEKLRSRGFVQNVDELSPEYKLRYDEFPGAGYYIPWRVVHKASSLSTPVRMVFDASSRTPGGESLNAILAKGQNTLASLPKILIKFRCLPFAFTGDIKMAYNNIFLEPAFVKFQKYLWREGLDPKNPLVTMLVLTLIYGVRPSGNLTIAGLFDISDHCVIFYPERALGAKVLKDGSYMDDVLSSHRSNSECRQAAEDLSFALSLGSMDVKAFTFSGEDPVEEVSGDLVHVGLLGYLWASREDLVKLDVKDLYLGKPKRGKLPPAVKGDIGEALLKGHFTRRTLVGKVAGVFDPIGLVTPITAKFKLDLHELCLLQLGWDDKIPDSYLEKWVLNLERIQELREVQFRRSLVPPDAASLDMELIVSSDASKDIAIATVHSRVLKTDGSYDVQLVAAKSKLVNTSTIPRGELTGALIGAVLSHTVRMVLQEQVKDYIHVIDSSIVLFWVMADSRPLQVAVRNRVIEIRRLTDIQKWYHIESENNIADLGTREAEIKDVSEDSDWQIGRSWMREPIDRMPIQTSAEITMSAEEKRAAAEEMKAQDFGGMTIMHLTDRVAERYAFSKYIVDPCQHPWPKVLRIYAAIQRFISNVKAKCGTSKGLTLRNKNEVKPIVFTVDELRSAELYFFRKCTKELRQFAKPKDWKTCSVLKDGVLHFAGRILDGQEINDVENVMSDLEPLSFVKPMIDRFSPVAYSIMLYSHQELSTHRNSVTTLRESRSVAYVIQGRDLAIEIREACLHCRRFKAKLLEVEMGKVHKSRLTIAPCFYFAQVDLFGPLTAICEHNHRSTCKVYGTVFKDPSTGAVAVYLMQNYSTPAFLQAFTRFSCRFGYPKKLFIDEGSQLMKACKQMELSFKAVSETVTDKYQVGIEFETCPVGGHNANGIVERSIREVKKIFNAVYSGLKLDMMSYETAFQWTANEMNNIPLCLGSRTDNLEHVDLITPNRLMLGRNNRRAPMDCATVSTPSRLMEQMNRVRDAWWKVWSSEKLQDYIPTSPKWTKSSPSLKVGDIVYFLVTAKEDSIGAPKWKIARVKEIEKSEDGLVRHVILEYKNAGENTYRTTRRAVRKIAVICPEGELELVDRLNAAAKSMNIAFTKQCLVNQTESETKET